MALQPVTAIRNGRTYPRSTSERIARNDPRSQSRRHYFTYGVAALLGAAALASCGSSASANGAKACVLVNKSLAIIAKSDTSTSNSHALNLLRIALPYAAVAAGSNGAWQPLEATLSETNRVGIGGLKSALAAECSPGNAGNVNGGGTFTQASIPSPAKAAP